MPGLQSPQQLLDLVSLNNLAANSVATIDLPTGSHEIEAVQIDRGTVTKALMNNWFVKLDGKIVWDFASTTDLELVFAFYRHTITATHVVLPFTLPHMEDRDQELITAMGLADVRKATIEVSIGAATLTTPPTAQYLRSRNIGDARYRPVGSKGGVYAANQSGLVRCFKRFNRTVSAAGTHTVQDVPRNGLLAAMHIIHDGNLTGAELRFGGLTQYKSTAASLAAFNNYGGMRTAQTNMMSFDFLLGNSPAGAVVLDGQMPDVILTASAASTFRIYWELLAQPSEL